MRICTFKLILFLSVFGLSFVNAQTEGVLTCSFLPVTQTAGYQIPRNVLAVWIQTDVGGFVKTKMRYVGASTNDHLPYWASNSGGPAGNALSGLCNRTDATSGATLPSFTAKTFTWDGKGVNGALNGTVVTDGIYQVTLQSTWGHLSNQTATYSYTFTKGPCFESQLPADNSNITGVKVNWVPTLVDTCSGIPLLCPKSTSITYTCSIETVTLGINPQSLWSPKINIYPNPSNGLLNVDYSKASNITIINTLGVVVFEEQLSHVNKGLKTIDMSGMSNGIYLVKVSNAFGTSTHKVFLSR